jgi:hypothetical protein
MIESKDAQDQIQQSVRLLQSHPDGLFQLYDSKFIRDHQQLLVQDCNYVFSTFSEIFPDTNSSATTNIVEARRFEHHEGYLLYNVFSIAAPSPHFYGLFRELTAAIRGFVPERNLYMQAWLNFQSSEEVLGWHTHDGYKYHGYISIEPRNTVTEFDGYEIKNRVGQIYVGKAFNRHRVVNLEGYLGKRITIGFDLVEPMDCRLLNRGFFPLIL